MSLKDYEHWNEDALYMWYQEEGRHPYEPEELDPMEESRIDCQAESEYEGGYEEAQEDFEEGHPKQDLRNRSSAARQGYEDGWGTAALNAQEDD